MKRSFYNVLSIVAVLTSLTGCRVYHEMHTGLRPDATFFAQKYVAWLPEAPENISYTRQMRDIACRRIETELQKKGYVFCPDSATIFLKLRIANMEEEEAVVFPPGNWPYAPLIYQYLESSITLMVHDKGVLHLWWACTVKGKIYHVNQISRGVKRAVGDMMQNFPPYTPLPFEVIFYQDELMIKTL